MLKGRVRRQDGVVRLNNRVGRLRGGVDGELELRLLSIVGRETLKQERTEAGASSTTEGMENEEALETRAVIRQTTDLVHHDIDLLLANGVVPTRV